LYRILTHYHAVPIHEITFNDILKMRYCILHFMRKTLKNDVEGEKYGDLSALFLKMHSKLLFLSRNAGTKDPAFLSRVLADTLAAAKEAMRGRNFAHSPYRTKIITLHTGAAAALVHLEQGELEKMREEILTALEAAAK